MQTIITNVSVFKYTLSPNAASSIADINSYTINKFGPRQAEFYLSNFRDRFKFLVAHPELGIVRDDIKKGYYCYFEGSHTIYYKIIDERIAIIDILPHSMEPTRHLGD